MEKNMKDKLGPVNVNGDITPITRKPIAQLNADDWKDLTADELFEQRNALLTRMQQVQQMSLDPSVFRQMQLGLQHIDSLLHIKLNPIPTEFS